MTKAQLLREVSELASKNRKLIGSLMHIHMSPGLNATDIRNFVKAELTSFINDGELIPEKPKRIRKQRELEPA